jgi:hypothetical protein
MTLHRDWRAILTRAWSVRLMLLAGLLSGLEVTLQIVVGLGYASIALAVLSGLVTAAALVARIVAQKDVPS